MSVEVPLITGATKLYGVIAHPSDHVRAPMVFNRMFAERGIDHVMVPISVPPEHFEAMIRALQTQSNFGGLTVTIPHKLAMAEMCDQLGAAATISGAVNAVRFNPDGTIDGDNFDGAGFVAGMLAQVTQLRARPRYWWVRVAQHGQLQRRYVPIISAICRSATAPLTKLTCWSLRCLIRAVSIRPERFMNMMAAALT